MASTRRGYALPILGLPALAVGVPAFAGGIVSEVRLGVLNDAGVRIGLRL